MKIMIMGLALAGLLLSSTPAAAIPVHASMTIQRSVSLFAPDERKIIGYRTETKRHWSWHGRARKTIMVPVYEAEAAISPVPEPQTYAMLLAGLAVVALLRARKK